MKDIIKDTEKRLFEEIQTMVEELPWDHKTNLDYFETCVHEAGHATTDIRICQDLGNPFGMFETRIEVRSDCRGKVCGYERGNYKMDKVKSYLFSYVPTLVYKSVGFSGAILSDEFFNYFYGWPRIHDTKKLMREYGARGDFRIYKQGILNSMIARSLVRLSYRDPLVRLTHLRLTRDVLKGRGLLIVDPRTYMK